jgi:hypothetical protein
MLFFQAQPVKITIDINFCKSADWGEVKTVDGAGSPRVRRG